uniref:(northern house mosquito) hypothetical protein n=1 Tax=Culex pipiens TaxID=7175 RepID=A0A8D8JVT4_CULPI
MPQVGVGLFDGEDFRVGVVFLLHATAAEFEKLLRILAVVFLDEVDEGQFLGGFEGDRRWWGSDLLLEFWEWGKRRHRFNVDRFEHIVVVTVAFDLLEGDFLIIFQLFELRLSLLNPQEEGVDLGAFIFAQLATGSIDEIFPGFVDLSPNVVNLNRWFNVLHLSLFLSSLRHGFYQSIQLDHL